MMAAPSNKRDRSEYLAEYYRKNRERLRAAKHAKYLENRDEHIAVAKQTNERLRPRKTPEPPPGLPPLRRRWAVIQDKVYFSSRLGYSQSDLLTAVSDLQISLNHPHLWDEARDKMRIRSLRQNYTPEKRAKRAQAVAEARRAAGAGTKEAVGQRMDPPTKRRWLVIGNRIFINPATPIDLDGLLRAVQAMRMEARRMLKAETSPSAKKKPAPKK